MKLSACYWHPNKNNFIIDFYNDDFVSMNIFNYLEKHGNMTKSLFFYHEPINYKHYNFGRCVFYEPVLPKPELTCKLLQVFF